MSILEGIRKQRADWRKPKEQTKAIAARPDLASREHIVSSWGGSQAAEISDGYAEYASVYKSYVWVRKAIDVTDRNVSPLPVRVVNSSGDALDKHPVSLLLARGNDRMSSRGVWSHWLTSMYLGGEGPLEIVDDRRGNPLWLWPRRPDLVLVQPDMSPERANYPTVGNYVVMPDQPQGKPMDVPPTHMIFDRFPHPLNPWRGIAPIAALRATITIDLFAMAWAKTFLQRGARPDYALVAPQGITQTERERLEAELMFKYSGVENWHKPVVLEEGITDIKTFSFPPADMEWVEQRQFTRDEIGALFGVPDEIMGYGKDTYENFQTALEVFWTLTLRPLTAHRDETLTHFFTNVRPMLAPGERVETDLTGVGVLQEDKAPKVEMASKLWIMGVPFNQLDEQLQLGIGPIPNGEFPNGTDPAEARRVAEQMQGGGGDGGCNQDGAPDDMSDDMPDDMPMDEEARGGDKAHRPFLPQHGTFTPEHIKALLLRLDPDDDEAEQRIRAALERRSTRELGRVLSDMLETLYPDGWGGDWIMAEAEAIRVHNAFLNEQKLKDALARAILDGADLGVSVGVAQLESIGFGFDWTLAHIAARDWAAAHTDDVLREIANVSARGVGQAVGRWFDNGEPLEMLRQDLGIFFSPERARRIAITEVTRAAAEGSDASYRESGVVEEREWASSMDERVCPICSGLTGKRRNFGESFDGASIQKPPAHTNCRCWLRPIVKGPNNG